METWDAIRARRNVRTYQAHPVPTATLDRIAEAGWRAPSASNRQHWEFIIVTDPDQLRRCPPSGAAPGTSPGRPPPSRWSSP